MPDGQLDSRVGPFLQWRGVQFDPRTLTHLLCCTCLLAVLAVELACVQSEVHHPMVSELPAPPSSTAVSHACGGLLAAVGAACLVVGRASFPGGSTPSLVSGFSWFGLGLLLLAVVPSALFAARPGLLGGPVSWALARGYHAPAGTLIRMYPRLAALCYLWMGLVLTIEALLLGNIPTLLNGDGPAPSLFPLLMLALASLPPLALIGILKLRLTRSRP